MISLLVSSILAVFTGLLSVPTKTATPFGLWQRADTQIEARFHPCGDKLCARITATTYKSRHARSGATLIQGAAKTAHNMWEGQLLDVESGKLVAGVITMHGPDTLNVKGCTALLLCSSDTWTRVN